MPIIEVDEDKLKALQAQLASANLSKATLDKLGANPKTRAALLGLMKEDNPALIIPEIDAAKPVMEKVTQLEKQLAEALKATADEKAETEKTARENTVKATIDAKRSDLKKRGWTDEGIAGIEKLMSDEGIMSSAAAEALFEKNTPKDEPILPSNYSRAWDFMHAEETDDSDIKAAVSLPKGQKQEQALRRWQTNTIQKWLQENPQFRGGRQVRA